MPIKDFTVGQPPTAADINRYFQQRHYAIKTASESVASSTTLQNDDHLFLAVSANTDFWLEAFLIYDAGTAADFKMGWSVPTNATLEWTSNALSPAADSTAYELWRRRRNASQDEICGALDNVNTSAGNVIALAEGLLRIGSSSGTLRLRWSQGTSTVTAARVLAGSMLMISRLVP